MKYTLKEDFAGKKKGEVFTNSWPDGAGEFSWKYKGSEIILKSTSELLKESTNLITCEILEFKDIDDYQMYNEHLKDESKFDLYIIHVRKNEVTINKIKNPITKEEFTVGDDSGWGVITAFKIDSVTGDVIAEHNSGHTVPYDRLTKNIERVIPTDECDVYYKGVAESVKLGEVVYFVSMHNDGVTKSVANVLGAVEGKLFATEQAAYDYVDLRTAVKESGLKVGDTGMFNSKPYSLLTDGKLNNADFKTSFIDYTSSYFIKDFKIIDGEIYAIISLAIENDYEYAFTLDSLINNKLKLAGKDVQLVVEKNRGEVSDVKMLYEIYTFRYFDVKKLINAIETIKAFRIADKQIEYLCNEKYQYNTSGYIPEVKTIRIGCSYFDIVEINALLDECEELIKRG